MNTSLLEDIITLRAAVGLLGEKEQNNWWPSSFFSEASGAFLGPVFTRTQSLARLSGVTWAASRVHDEFIGVGAVYHLFRLPESLAQRIVSHMQQAKSELELPSAATEAIAWLQQYASETPVATIGPIRVGGIAQLQDENSWREVAALYLYAFEMGSRIYPYFRNTTE